MATIKITGVDEVLALLAKIPAALPVIGVAIAEAARAKIATYPPPSGKPQPFVSDKARRYFFAALRRGEITVPYQRGSKGSPVGRSWVVEPTASGATLTNTSAHAPFVHSATGQAAYHKGTWKTDAMLAEQLEADGTVERVAEAVVKKILGDAG